VESILRKSYLVLGQKASVQKKVIFFVIAFSIILVCAPQIYAYAKELTNNDAADLTPAGKTWVQTNTTQCADPWEKDFDDWFHSHNYTNANETESINIIKNFFQKNSIQIFDMKYKSWATKDMGFCAACNCASGETLSLLVSNSNVSKMKELGYSVEFEPEKDGSNTNETGNATLTGDGTISIISIQPTNQQGNPVSAFGRGTNGFVKVSLSSQSSQTALTTVDLIGSDLTSLGTGSIKNNLSQKNEITISFFIPDSASNGTANIYVDVYSDWPEKGGVPLTKELRSVVQLGDSMILLKNSTTVAPNPPQIPSNSTISPIKLSCQRGTTSVMGVCEPTMECPQTYFSNYYIWDGVNCIYKFPLTNHVRSGTPWGAPPSCEDPHYRYNGTQCILTHRITCPLDGLFINAATCVIPPVKKDCPPYFSHQTYGFPLYSPDSTTGICTINYHPVVTTEIYSVGKAIGISQYSILQVNPESITVRYYNMTCFAICYEGNPFLVTKVFNVGSSFTSGTGCGSSQVEYATLVSTSGNTTTFTMARSPKIMSPCPVCLSGDSEISTPSGKVNVKNIRDDMVVWSTDSNGTIIKSHVIKIDKTFVGYMHRVIDLKLVDGRELFVSSNHPTYNGKIIGNLKVGETYDGSKVKSIKLVPYKYQFTYDILPDSQTGDYFANGILVGSTLKQ